MFTFKLNTLVIKYIASLLVFISFTLSNAHGQDTIPAQIIDEVLLTGSRMHQPLPWTYERDTLKNGDFFQSSLRQAFDRQAGIQAFNGENFAQDVRIAIRGYGSRAAFGIRGIKLYQDGVPLTSPDGTTQLDELSSFDIQSMNILRSGLAARLGNSAGGAISLKSMDYFRGGRTMAHVNQFGSINVGFKYGFVGNKLSNVASINHHYFNGKRDYTQSSNTTFYNKMRFFISDKWQLEWLASIYVSPLGTDPGALSLTEVAKDKFSANSRNKEFEAGESVRGLMTAFISKYFINDNTTLQSNFFYRKRDFNARLPFESGGWVDLNRDFGGMNHSYSYTGIKNTSLMIGTSVEYQDDHRQLFQNLKGLKGLSSTDQHEKVWNISVYQQFQWQKEKWNVQQMLRWDQNTYRLTDNFEADGSQDGQQSFKNFNGALGVGYSINTSHHLFANISTSFEMPTLNELTNNPAGMGFNPDLKPERSKQAEGGYRLEINSKLKAQATAFFIKVDDQIVSYELPETPGRRYYSNAGITNRTGLECNVGYQPFRSWFVEFNYTFSHFKYNKFESNAMSYSGNFQTLIPKHKLQLNIDMPVSRWLIGSLFLAYNDEMWLNDSNSVKSESYGECNILLTTTESVSKRFKVGMQGNNLFNWMPYSNFRINAAAARYFEVATPMHFGIFVKVRW